jgi:hypothetical protein
MSKRLPVRVQQAIDKQEKQDREFKANAPKTVKQVAEWFVESQEKRDLLVVYAAQDKEVRRLLLEFQKQLEGAEQKIKESIASVD